MSVRTENYARLLRAASVAVSSAGVANPWITMLLKMGIAGFNAVSEGDTRLERARVLMERMSMEDRNPTPEEWREAEIEEAELLRVILETTPGGEA